MKKTPFTVTYGFGYGVARFSCRADALRFARMVTAVGSIWTTDTSAEVRAKDGLIGQFRAGTPSDEFAHLDRD